MKTAFYVEYQNKQAEESEIVNRIKDAWLGEGRLIKEIKTLNIYFKPEENACYYTINDDIQGKLDLFA